MRVDAIVFAEESSKSKKPFSAGFNAEERKKLTAAMLEDVLVALRSSVVREVVVVGNDSDVREVVDWCGVSFISTGQTSLNKAVEKAIVQRIENKADSVLVLPSNIPLISSSDIDGIVELGCQEPSVVLSPSIKGSTNAVFLNPPNLLPPSFGPASFFKLVKAALNKNVVLKFYSSRELALDMECEEDLCNLLETRNKKVSKQVFKQIKLQKNQKS